MASKITYKGSVAGDLKNLDRPTARRIVEKLEGTLAENPRAGVPLSGEFRGLFKLRVGDYRVLYTFTPEGVLVLRIGHRREVYRR